jgi:hypothetical protein
MPVLRKRLRHRTANDAARQKTRNSSAFLPREQKIAQVRARPKVCSMPILPDTVGCLRGGGAARHLHTKLSGVTVIFFLL